MKREIFGFDFDAPDLNHVRANGSQKTRSQLRLINQGVIGDCCVVTGDVTGEEEQILW